MRLVEDLEALVDDLHVLSQADFAVGIGRRAVAADAGEGDAVEVGVGRGHVGRGEGGRLGRLVLESTVGDVARLGRPARLAVLVLLFLVTVFGLVGYLGQVFERLGGLVVLVRLALRDAVTNRHRSAGGVDCVGRAVRTTGRGDLRSAWLWAVLGIHRHGERGDDQQRNKNDGPTPSPNRRTHASLLGTRMSPHSSVQPTVAEHICGACRLNVAIACAHRNFAKPDGGFRPRAEPWCRTSRVRRAACPPRSRGRFAGPLRRWAGSTSRAR